MLSKGTLKFVTAAGAAGIASVGLAGAVGVGLGGAFAAAGVGVALLNKNVQKTFADLGTSLKKQLDSISKPVQDAMLGLAKYVGESFKTMRPVFAQLFKDIAPLITVIGQGLVRSVADLVYSFQPLVKVVTPIVDELFAQLPDLIANLGAGLKAILAPLSGNTSAFGMLLQTIGGLLPIVGSIIGSLVRLGQQIMPAFHEAILAVGTALDSGLMKVLPLVGRAIVQMLPPVARLISALLGLAARVLPVLLPVLSRIVVTLANAAAKVLPQILPSLVAVVAAFASLLPALVPLVAPVLYLAKSVSNLIPPLAALAGSFLAALVPAFRLILPLLVQVVNQVGTALAAALREAAPSLVLVARAAVQILVALTPLIPVVVKAALAFLPLIPAAARIAAVLAQGLVPIVLALTPLLVLLAPTLVKVAIAAKLWSVAQGVLNVVLAANPIGLVIVAIAALAAGLVYAYHHSETFRKVVDASFRVVWRIVQAVWGWIRDHWPLLLGILAGPIGAAVALIIRNWNKIRPVVGAVIDFIIRMIRIWFNTTADIVAGILHLFGKLPGPMGAPFRAAEKAVKAAKATVNTQLDAVQRRVNALRGKDIPITANAKVTIAKQTVAWLRASHVKIPQLAGGGRVTQGSGPTADDVLARLSRGETVVSARDSADPGFRAWAASRRIPGYATGGRIGSLQPFADASARALARGSQHAIDALSGALGRALGKMIDAAVAAMSAATGVFGAIPGGGNARANMILGQRMAAARGWAGGNWTALRSLWIGESGWNQYARNRSSGAYGIPQALPPGKMGAAANPPQSNPGAQIAWGLAYIASRYGSPSRAWSAWLGRSPHWYDRGGYLPPGLSLAYNGTGRPEPVGIDYDRLADALARQPIILKVNDREIARANRQGDAKLAREG